MEKKNKALKALESLNSPQKALFDTVADYTDTEKGDTAEKTAFNLVQKAADKLGLSKDSAAVNAAKALGVAGLSVAADPLNLIPGLGPAKRMLKLGSTVGKSRKAAKVLNNAKLPKGAYTEAAPGAVRHTKSMEQGTVFTTKASSPAAHAAKESAIEKAIRSGKLKYDSLKKDTDKASFSKVLKKMAADKLKSKGEE